MTIKKDKIWKKDYTYVLVANILYVLIFSIIMKLYA